MEKEPLNEYVIYVWADGTWCLAKNYSEHKHPPKQEARGLTVPGKITITSLMDRIDQLQDLMRSDLKRCYQCSTPTTYLFPDSRCTQCTRFTPEELTGCIQPGEQVGN